MKICSIVFLLKNVSLFFPQMKSFSFPRLKKANKWQCRKKPRKTKTLRLKRRARASSSHEKDDSVGEISPISTAIVTTNQETQDSDIGVAIDQNEVSQNLKTKKITFHIEQP